MNNGDADPTQTCGFSIGYLDQSASTNEYLPHPVQHQGIMCTPNQCSNDDMHLIAKYLIKMAGYSEFVAFCGEGGDCDNGNNNNNNNQDEELEVYISIPETRGSWRCDEEEGNGGEGMISNDNFPDECASPTPSPDEDFMSDSKYATAAIFAIICGLGMGVFMCLFVYYYRQVQDLRTGKGGTTSYGANTSQAANYQNA